MKRQIIFIVVSIVTIVLSIWLNGIMMDAVGGTGLGALLYMIAINVCYTIYAIYHLFTYKVVIEKNDIIVILIIYWITVLPFMTIWIWGF